MGTPHFKSYSFSLALFKENKPFFLPFFWFVFVFFFLSIEPRAWGCLLALAGIKVRRATTGRFRNTLSTVQHFGVVPLILWGEGERLEGERGEYQH